jgi:hypothetical protein
MTIDELNEFMSDHGFCNTRNNEDLPKIYVADLVESAIEEGYNKAIDDFVKKYKNCDSRGIQCRKALNCADCIAEQLKAGGKNENRI